MPVIYLSWTNTAMSQTAKESLLDSSFATPSSGISRKTRVFFMPYKWKRKLHLEQELKHQHIKATMKSTKAQNFINLAIYNSVIAMLTKCPEGYAKETISIYKRKFQEGLLWYCKEHVGSNRLPSQRNCFIWTLWNIFLVYPWKHALWYRI